MTPRTLARQIVSRRVDQVAEYVSHCRDTYGDAFVDASMQYISTVLAASQQTTCFEFTKQETEKIVAALTVVGYTDLAFKIIKSYEM